MTSLRRKLVALFFTVLFLAATVAVTGCSKQQPPTKTTPKKAPSTGLE